MGRILWGEMVHVGRRMREERFGQKNVGGRGAVMMTGGGNVGRMREEGV